MMGKLIMLLWKFYTEQIFSKKTRFPSPTEEMIILIEKHFTDCFVHTGFSPLLVHSWNVYIF